jgi:Flp pilus assembly protein TadG
MRIIREQKAIEIIMKLRPGRLPSLKRLLRDERGIAAIMLTIYLPFFVGLMTLAVDVSYILRTRNMLQVTAEAAALAATYQLPDNSPCTTQGSACFMAKQYAEKNLAEAKYGMVLADSDVVVGKWTPGCLGGGASNETCFAPVPGGTSCVTFLCNSVKATTRMAQSNNNPLNLTFAQYVGIPTFDVSVTAIAVYGNDLNAPTWNSIISMDISGSFTEEIAQGRAAAQGLLNCMHENAASGSKLGITLFAGCSGASCNPGLTTFRSMLSTTQDNTYTALQNKIGQISNCTNNDASSISMNIPKCNTATNQAAGIQAAFNQFCPTGTCTPSSTSKNAMVIVSDGLPVCGSGAPAGCTAQSLRDAAVQQANTAAAQGIDIYTIYYGSDSAGRDFLASLKRGNGIALDTPAADQLSTLIGQICAKALVHRLVW